VRTESGTPAAPKNPADPDLAELITRWPGLHESARLRIMAIVRERIDPEAY